jgi:hypothetical protein
MPRLGWTLHLSRHALTGSQVFPQAHHPSPWGGPAAALAAVLLFFSPAVAQPPPNDDVLAATPVTIPFGEALNTTEATTAPDDPDCAGQGATVWYSFTPDADGTYAADTFGSDYDTTLSVYTGAPGSLTQIACNDDFNSLQSVVIWEATAGTTYLIMVGSFASGPGGNLIFGLDVAPPPLVLDLALSPKGSVVPKTGTATVRGTVVCNEPATVFGISGRLEQRKGRVILGGDFFVGEFACEPPETAWSATVTASNGLFTGGKARVLNVSASGCGEDFLLCDDAFIPGPITMQLTGKK